MWTNGGRYDDKADCQVIEWDSWGWDTLDLVN